MAEPFSDQDRNDTFGKRPAPTIEGTATEISVDAPGAEDAPHAEDIPSGSSDTTEPEAAEGAPAEPVIGDIASTAEAEAEVESDVASSSDEASAAEDARTEQVAPEEPRRRKGPPPRTNAFELKSFFTHLAAGLLGGLIGVLALAFAWNKLPLRQGQSHELAVLQSKVAELSSRPASEAGVDPKELAALDTRIAALETGKTEPSADVAGLNDRVAKLEQTINALAESAKNGGSVADTAAIETKLGDLEKKLDAKIDADLGAEKSANAKTTEAMQGEIGALKAKLGALAESGLASAEATSSEDITALDKRVSKLEATVPDLATAIEEGTAGANSGALAIAFSNLRQAVDSGKAYGAELTALRTLDPKAALGTLPSYADTGIPTLPQLAASFRTAADAASTAAPPTPDQSFLDTVISSARSAVQIRRLDSAETASGSEGSTARAAADLDKGDLAAAVKEIESLPSPQHDAFAAWLASAKARLDADATLTTLEGSLLTAMGGTKTEAKP